jgi:pimeloyl-ACP methyl ester carboxylesterase
MDGSDHGGNGAREIQSPELEAELGGEAMMAISASEPLRYQRAIRHRMGVIASAAILTSLPFNAAKAYQIGVSWEKVACPFDSSKSLLPVTCGRLKVPENYQDPQGRSIEIAFMVVKAPRNVDPEHPLIYLNGGPGGTSLIDAEMLVTRPGVRQLVVDRDWVFFDQRGTGRSTPALYCPQTDWKGIKACRDKFIKEGVDLSQYNSVQIAKDMEALRKALGVKQWNLWGSSYGSRLAFTVAHYYPASVHSIIHEAPDLPEDQELVGDYRGIEIVVDKLFAKCAADAPCSSKFPELRSRFLAALPRLRQQPVSIGDERLDDNTAMSFISDWLFGGFYLTFEYRIQTLLAYMDAVARGNGALMLQIQQRMAQQHDIEQKKAEEKDPTPNPFPIEGRIHRGQSFSVDCNEEKAFESMEEYERAAGTSEVMRSLFGKDLGAYYLQRCGLWPSGRADPIENTHVYYDGPQLVFTGELDASQSGPAGYKIAMLYANARNVVFKNGSHGQVPISDSDTSKDYNYYWLCAVGLARQFLADPRQKLDTRCAETRQIRLVP